jgi:hypothetical protein
MRIVKGTVGQDFLPPFFAWKGPPWATDQPPIFFDLVLFEVEFESLLQNAAGSQISSQQNAAGNQIKTFRGAS